MTRRAWIAVGGSLGLAVVLAVALIVAIAAGGEDEPTAAAPPGDVQTFGSGPDPEVQECLEAQGVEPPQPGAGPSGSFDPERLEQAFEACGVEGRMIAPSFSPGSGGGG